MRDLFTVLPRLQLGSVLVSARLCTETEQRMAEADGRVFADGDGLAVVLRLPAWLLYARRCVEVVTAMNQAAKLAADPIYFDPPPTDTPPDPPPAGGPA